MNVIKIGGNEIQEPYFLPRLADAVANMPGPVAVVHGGGRAIGDMQSKLGLAPRKIDGLRVTDEQSLQVAQMVLSGDVNKRIVQALLARGVQAIGLSGVDGGLLRCTKKVYEGHDLGWVGQIADVDGRVLHTLSSQGFTPVISPISLGQDGAIYNVNADEAAGAVAQAVGAATVWFISNVAAVLDGNGQPIDALTEIGATDLIKNGAIRDGMIPKVHAALTLVGSGISEVVIADIDGLLAGNGTRFKGMGQQQSEA